MGATYMAQTGIGSTVEVAYQQVIAEITSRFEDWDDAASKGGDTKWIQVWPDPVDDCAIEWMRGWVEQHPPPVVTAYAEARARALDELDTDVTKAARRAGVVPRRKPDPSDKFGPWLVFPLASGGWHFFGWVNT